MPRPQGTCQRYHPARSPDTASPRSRGSTHLPQCPDLPSPDRPRVPRYLRIEHPRLDAVPLGERRADVEVGIDGFAEVDGVVFTRQKTDETVP
jgi:hypothetical protein